MPPGRNRGLSHGHPRGPSHTAAPMSTVARTPAVVPRGRIIAMAAPAVLATFGASFGFAALKFVLIGELGLDFDPATHQPLPWAWLEHLVQICITHGSIKETITQGLAAVITLGVILGYFVNSPLSGAWTCARLFFVSGFGVAVGTLAVKIGNPWIIMVLVGIAYGAACAARGKCVPLIAQQTGISNTFVSGIINAAMVIGLLFGTLGGMLFYNWIDSSWIRHLVIAIALVISAVAGAFVRAPEPTPIPFVAGLQDLFRGSLRLIISHWPLLIGGGLAWGIASAASLAIFMDAVQRLQLEETRAVSLVVFPGIGAIVGNLFSHHLVSRRWVVITFLIWGAITVTYPKAVDGYWTAACFAAITGACFAAGANVLDARFLKNAAAENEAGRGGTMMSLTHSLCIFFVGTTLAVSMLAGWISALAQFEVMAGLIALTAGVACFAKLGK